MSRRAALGLLFAAIALAAALALDGSQAVAQSWAPARRAALRQRFRAARSAPQSSAQPLSNITPTPTAGTATAGPTSDGTTHAQVSKGSGTLPNDHGQVWREYDITPYTVRNTTTSHPEQAIVDWILRETGYEAWHSTPVGLL